MVENIILYEDFFKQKKQKNKTIDSAKTFSIYAHFKKIRLRRISIIILIIMIFNAKFMKNVATRSLNLT